MAAAAGKSPTPTQLTPIVRVFEDSGEGPIGVEIEVHEHLDRLFDHPSSPSFFKVVMNVHSKAKEELDKLGDRMFTLRSMVVTDDAISFGEDPEERESDMDRFHEIFSNPQNMIGYGSEKPLTREQTDRNFIRDANRSRTGQFFTGYLIVNLQGDVIGRAAIGGGYSSFAEAKALDGCYGPATAETQMGVMIDRKHYSDELFEQVCRVMFIATRLFKEGGFKIKAEVGFAEVDAKGMAVVDRFTTTVIDPDTLGDSPEDAAVRERVLPQVAIYRKMGMEVMGRIPKDNSENYSHRDRLIFGVPV